MPLLDVIQPTTIVAKHGTKKAVKKIVRIIEYPTTDYFIRGHIDEVNRAYSNHCYTSVYILTRKIIENLIREILTKKFPPNSLENKELYYSVDQRRFKDFSVILKNLLDKKDDFDPAKSKAIMRLYDRAIKFKEDTNDATHSWFHLIENQKEIDELHIQSLIN